jgi:hypothetical protein
MNANTTDQKIFYTIIPLLIIPFQVMLLVSDGLHHKNSSRSKCEEQLRHDHIWRHKSDLKPSKVELIPVRNEAALVALVS